ncbi:RsmG family class I SAM-dependent methyltransferase [Aquihabitans sp. McL0605]|uniref:RsmG family class I SAM-dependent methyltransferase n=1 Tax=Aquihabitans sp. McL0605 TaxID=3415671 RepID=UPI003CEC23C3
MTVSLTDLLLEARQRGFLGPGPVERHLDHARAFVVAVQDAPTRALDLGAGGGLPGLVLAVEFWPETQWVFLDAQQKRTQFLQEAIEDLDLEDRVSVVVQRAEEFGRDDDHRGAYDLVVSRSFGPPAVTIECAAPLLRAGGSFVASEPPEGTPPGRWPIDGLEMLGCGPAHGLVVGDDPEFHLVRIDQETLAPERYPRRVGIPAKRPLF